MKALFCKKNRYQNFVMKMSMNTTQLIFSLVKLIERQLKTFLGIKFLLKPTF